MADDNTLIVPPDVADNLSAADAAAISAKKSFDATNESVDKMAGFFGVLNDEFIKVKSSLQNNTALTKEQTTALSLLAIGALGATESFTKLANVDFRGLNTFKGTFDDIVESIKGGDGAINKLAEIAKNVFGVIMPDAVKYSVNAAGDFVKSLAIGADNTLRLENAIIQLSAQTGQLGDVYDQAGTHLTNINAAVEKQWQLMNDTADATNKSIDVVSEYYSQLGTIPGALDKVIDGVGVSNQSINLLTASMKLADGAGRNYKDVIDDLHKAYEDYNLTGEDALVFTARMTEISDKFHVQLKDVRESLRNTADAFKVFGNESEAATRILNNYLQALMDTGVSGTVAIDIIHNMTDQVKNLDIAQKSFLSAQTGGPGGLMGAFQIDKLLREGKLDEVFDKVRETFQKQFGDVVGLEEAAASPEAAAQMTKQIALLKQGPLGQFARTDVEAERILDALKGGKPVEGLAEDILTDQKNSIDKGTDIEKQSLSELTAIRNILQRTQAVAGVGALNFIQGQGTAGVGSPIAGDVFADMRDALSQFMESGTKKGVTTATEAATMAYTDISGENATELLADYSKIFERLPKELKAHTDKIKEYFGKGDAQKASDEYVKTMMEIEVQKKALNKNDQNYKDKLTQLNKEAESIAIFATPTMNTESGITKFPAPMTNMAAGTTVTSTGTTTVKPPITAGSGTKTVDLNLHISGYCLRCKQEIDDISQPKTNNVAISVEP